MTRREERRFRSEPERTRHHLCLPNDNTILTRNTSFSSSRRELGRRRRRRRRRRVRKTCCIHGFLAVSPSLLTCLACQLSCGCWLVDCSLHAIVVSEIHESDQACPNPPQCMHACIHTHDMSDNHEKQPHTFVNHHHPQCSSMQNQLMSPLTLMAHHHPSPIPPPQSIPYIPILVTRR